MQTRGVITLADAAYFPGLLALHASIQSSSGPFPVGCFDIGLTEAQRRIAQQLDGIEILPLPEAPLIAELEAATRRCAPLAKPGKRIDLCASAPC